MPDYQIDHRKPNKRPPSRQFLHYLSDWFYRNHSAQAHMSFLGMMKLGAVIALEDLPAENRERMKNDGIPRLMTTHLALGATLLLAVCSELQNYLRFEEVINLRILTIWHTLIPNFPDAQDIFERRYKDMFPALLITPPIDEM